MNSSGWPVASTYERARRRRAYRRLASLVKRSSSGELLPLEEVRRRLRAFDQTYVGIRPIPVSAIVGTVDRTGEFDREFLPRNPRVEERWRRVERAHPGGDFPPIVVFQIGDAYFVVDGHHRVAIARQRGQDHLDAEVTVLRSRWALPPDADLPRIIHAEQERIFMEESGLERARPEARIEFTRPHGYVQLLDNVKIHGYHLMQETGRVLAREEVAADWYDRIYLPALQAIGEEGLHELYPKATEADLFLWLYQRIIDLFPERGGLGYVDAARGAKPHGRPRRRGPLRRS